MGYFSIFACVVLSIVLATGYPDNRTATGEDSTSNISTTTDSRITKEATGETSMAKMNTPSEASQALQAAIPGDALVLLKRK